MVFSGHVLPEVERVADRVAIMRKGRLMHLENMHTRRSLRMLLVHFTSGEFPVPDPTLGLSERERNDGTVLFEHRGELAPLLDWLASVPIDDIAIGTEDLRSLYDRFHGPNTAGEE